MTCGGCFNPPMKNVTIYCLGLFSLHTYSTGNLQLSIDCPRNGSFVFCYKEGGRVKDTRVQTDFYRFVR